MFKNAIVYRIEFTEPTILGEIDFPPFFPCDPTEERSIGWVPPRGIEYGALVEFVGGQAIMKLMIETKVVPASAVAKLANGRAQDIEATTGRKPGKKEMRDLRDEARLELLPTAFPKQTSVGVWIDRTARLLVIDAASQTRADLVVTELVRAVNGLVVTPLSTQSSPQALMTGLLFDESPQQGPGFCVDRACELKSNDEEKSAVKYNRHSLLIDEVWAHVRQGKLPVKLALTWADRVSFTLSASGVISKLKFLDVVLGDQGEMEDAFGADAAIMTGEMAPLIDDLIKALGGEPEVEIES